MRSSLLLFLFIMVLVSDTIMALDDKTQHDGQHGNHTLIQPRQSSISVNLDSRLRFVTIIQTPRFPNKYRSKTQVKWYFWTENPEKRINVNCDDFHLRPRNKRGDCTDYLEVTSGGITTWYCGNSLSKGEFISNTNSIELTFKSSTKRNKRFHGFNCTVTPIYIYPEIQECNCGVYTPPIAKNDKIVGGNTAKDNQFPWQALMLANGFLCGGSLINDQYVLTAAHCTDGYVPSDIQIYLGAWCLPSPSPGLQQFDVMTIKQHTGYNSTTFDSDIALLKLNTNIDFSQTQFRPICLPLTNTNPVPDEDDVEAVISGFGRLNATGPLPECLQFAIVPTMTNERCQFFYNGFETITHNMICAGFPGIGGIDSCQGDSGGPMVTNATSVTLPLVNYYVQIGVVSWGYGCAEPEFPGVYARVSSYIDWINSNTAESSTCPPPA